MRIGIDASTILNPERGEAGGVGHYTFMLIRHLLKMDEDFKSGKNEYVLFFDNRVRKKEAQRFKMKGIKICHFPFSSYGRYLPGVYSEVLINATFLREKLDFLHSPGGRIPLAYQGKTVLTFSDLAIHKFSDMFPRYQRLSVTFTRSMLAKANAVIADSRASKGDIAEHFGIPSAKITAIYKGVDQRFFSQADKKEIARVKVKYNIKGKYFLFLSTLKPINNLVRLTQIFSRVRHELAKSAQAAEDYSRYQLVLAGKEGWLSAEEVRETAKELQINKDVVLTGYIPPEDLNGLFQGADLFLLPPLYEEFGSPALEAMASGVPVIASKIPALLETLDNAAVFVDPLDDIGWVREITRLIKDKNKRAELAKLGLEQAKKYTWEKTAEETLAVYRHTYRA